MLLVGLLSVISLYFSAVALIAQESQACSVFPGIQVFGQITWKMLPIPAPLNEYELTHVLCLTYQPLCEIVTRLSERVRWGLN